MGLASRSRSRPGRGWWRHRPFAGGIRGTGGRRGRTRPRVREGVGGDQITGRRGGGASGREARQAIDAAQREVARAEDAFAERNPLVAAKWFARAAADALGHKPPDFHRARDYQDRTERALARSWDLSIHRAAAQRLAAVPSMRPLLAVVPPADALSADVQARAGAPGGTGAGTAASGAGHARASRTTRPPLSATRPRRSTRQHGVVFQGARSRGGRVRSRPVDSHDGNGGTAIPARGSGQAGGICDIPRLSRNRRPPMLPRIKTALPQIPQLANPRCVTKVSRTAAAHNQFPRGRPAQLPAREGSRTCRKPAPRKIYDFHSIFYDATFGRLVSRRIERAIRHMNIADTDRVLDLGIGTGVSLNFYPRPRPDRRRRPVRRHAPRGPQEDRRARLDHATVFQADALRLPFADDTFDHVFISHVISVVSDPCQLVREAQRVAKPNARIVIVNHFQSTNRFIALVEKWLCPLCTKLGWRSDLALQDLDPPDRASRSTTATSSRASTCGKRSS